jgi:hypothetical protein
MYFDSRATPAVPATNATPSSVSTTRAAKLFLHPCGRGITPPKLDALPSWYANPELSFQMLAV